MNRFAPIGADSSGSDGRARRTGLSGAGFAVAQDSTAQSQVAPPPVRTTAASASIAWATASCGSIPAPANWRSADGPRPAGPARWCPDERAALESEIGRLQRDNAELKKSLLSRGIELPSGIVAASPGRGAGAARQRAGRVRQRAENAERRRARPRVVLHGERLAPAGRYDGRSAAGHSEEELTEYRRARPSFGDPSVAPNC